MPRQFAAAKPLQAGKFAVVVGALVFGLLGFLRIIPGQQLAAFFLVIVLGLGLALVVAAETLFAAYRSVRADHPVTARLTARPAYTAVRGVELVVGVLAAGTFVVTLATLPGEDVPAPAAVGVLLFGVGLGLLVLGASLVRALTEYYYHRRGRRA